jgi:hypothetical protein
VFGDWPSYTMGFSFGFFIPEKELVLGNPFFLGGGEGVYFHTCILLVLGPRLILFYFCLVDGRYTPAIILPQVP